MQDIFETCIFSIFKDRKKGNCLNNNEIIAQIPVEIKQQHSSNRDSKGRE